MSKLNKTDKVDSEVLAQFAMTSDLHYWKPLASHIKLLNALLERRAVLLEDLLRERNRLEKAEFINIVEPVLASIQASIQYLQCQIKDLDQQINDHIDQNSDLKKIDSCCIAFQRLRIKPVYSCYLFSIVIHLKKQAKPLHL